MLFILLDNYYEKGIVWSVAIPLGGVIIVRLADIIHCQVLS